METLCSRSQDRFQVYNENGDVRLCGWAWDCNIGNIIDNTVEEVYCGQLAQAFRNRHAKKDFSLCDVDSCPYLAMGTVGEIEIPFERERRFPKEIAIGFERVCNYACTSCTIHDAMKANAHCDLESKYKQISKRLSEALPHATCVGANGCGELFVSKYTLELLANWRPIAPAEKCRVVLETNGSLFDEEHWKQIENLGQYYLDVDITIMSFKEDIYQFLSGSRYPMSRITDNLGFVKSLREKGIINRLELATVVQEQNFREMPEFTRRCIEEFGADKVRLRPYKPWGAETRDAAWHTDIRVPDHPLHQEYKRVMSDPIFKHPKCDEGSGGLDANWASKSPFKAELDNEEMMSNMVVYPEDLEKRVKKIFGSQPVVIYGYEAIGKLLAKKMLELGLKIPYIVSYQRCAEDFFNVPVVALSDLNESYSTDYGVIMTPMHAINKIDYALKMKGFERRITVEDLMKGNG